MRIFNYMKKFAALAVVVMAFVACQPDTPETPNTPSETTPSEKGCGASLSGLAGAALTALGWMLLRKRED